MQFEEVPGRLGPVMWNWEDSEFWGRLPPGWLYLSLGCLAIDSLFSYVFLKPISHEKPKEGHVMVVKHCTRQGGTHSRTFET